MKTAIRPRRSRKAGAETGQVPILVAAIKKSAENDLIYRPFDVTAADDAALVESVRHSGVNTALVITRDFHLVSGHRRLAAATAVGLEAVPCVILERKWSALTPDERVRLLRDYNLQREKSRDEQLREELVVINPDGAYSSLIEYRQHKAGISVAPMELRPATQRSAISPAKLPFLNAIQTILRVHKAFWPLSVRQVHYLLLNAPPLKHASKPHSIYQNNMASYKSLCDLAERARIIGELPMEAIADETRPISLWPVFASPRDFVRRELDSFLMDFWRDLQQSQPNHIELVVEKNTAAGLIRPVAAQYCIPMTSSRGYASLPPRFEMAQRFRRSGKSKLILLVVSDFDPDGEEIAHAWASSLLGDFDIQDIHPVKVALTHEQVKQHSLVPNMEAKESSSRYRRFVDKYGKDVFELEALPPAELQNLVRTAIDSVLDVDAFNAELDAEKRDATWIKEKRLRAIQEISGSVTDTE